MTLLNNPQWSEIFTLIDYEPDECLDAITKEASLLFHVPIAMINLITDHNIVFKSCVGDTQGATLKHHEAFCTIAATHDKPFMISNTSTNPAFKNYGLVTGPKKIKSYLGQAIKAPDNSVLGTLCVMDTKPRVFTKTETQVLIDLAHTVEEKISELLNFQKTATSIAVV